MTEKIILNATKRIKFLLQSNYILYNNHKIFVAPLNKSEL